MTGHPVRGRLNAWLLDSFDGYMHAEYGALKSRLFADLPETVLELGPGAGANLRYYPRKTRLIAVEPNLHMRKRLSRHAAQLALNPDIHPMGAEKLDLESNSLEFACATLVLCSVVDPERVVAEVRRVLRPGGRFVCIEHVMAPPGSPTAMLQKTIRRPWRWTFEGCDLCNRTEAVIREAGFRKVEIEPLVFLAVFGPVRYQIAAVCTV